MRLGDELGRATQCNSHLLQASTKRLVLLWDLYRRRILRLDRRLGRHPSLLPLPDRHPDPDLSKVRLAPGHLTYPLHRRGGIPSCSGRRASRSSTMAIRTITVSRCQVINHTILARPLTLVYP
jgi:hypothetical protein